MEAAKNLRENQKQLDMDGTMVGVSRQALEEVLESHAELLDALKLAESVYRQNCVAPGEPSSVLAAMQAAIAKAA